MLTGHNIRVVLVSSDPFSQPVTRNRLIPFMNVLKSKGMSVGFVCPAAEENQQYLPAGVELVEVPLNAERQANFVLRTLQEVRNARALLKAARNLSAGVYLLSIPSMFLAFLSPVYLRSCTTVLDIRDLTWEYLSSDSIVFRLSKNIFRLCFRWSLNSFKAVCVTNPTEMDYVLPRWKGAGSPLLVTNGISREQFEKLGRLEASHAGRLTVSYIGNVGLAQNLETFLQAAYALPECDFRIIGAGTDFERIKNLADEMQLNNLLFTGRIPWDEVRAYYNSSDVLYAQLTPAYSGAMPSKLYEYLATGKYVVYGGQHQAAERLAEFEHNCVVPPCDAEALVAALRKLTVELGCKELHLGNRQKIEREYIREDAAERLADAVVGLLY